MIRVSFGKISIRLLVWGWLSLSWLVAPLAAWQTEPVPHWPHWRGPLQTGAVESGTAPTTWSESENVVWKVPLPGTGSGTPIILGDRIWLTSAVVTDRFPDQPVSPDPRAMTQPPGTVVEFQLHCLDRRNGEVLWTRTLVATAPREGIHPSSSYAASSPATDGRRLYVSCGSHGIFAVSLEGEVLWSRDLGTMNTRRGWGEAVSPAVAQDRLIIMWDQEDQSRIHALDPATGKTLWQQDRDEPTTWATPLVVTASGTEQVVTAGTNRIRSYRAADGELLWESDGLTLNAIPTPVARGSHVILMSGYRGNAAVSLDLATSLKAPQVDWTLQRHTPYVPSPCLTQGRLYFTQGLAGILNCVDAETGEARYPLTRLEGLKQLYASPVATPEHVYLVSRDGATLVIKNSDTFEPVSINQLDGEFDSSPAIALGQLFLRSKTHLYCIGR